MRGTQLVSIMESDGALNDDPGPTLAAIRRLGVNVVRYDVRWRTIAPDAGATVAPAFDAANPSAYPPGSWAKTDHIVRDAHADGLRVYFTLTGDAPAWATGGHMPKTSNCPCGQWEPSARAFGAFVHAVGERYDGHYLPRGADAPLPRVSFWSIWNEPNYGVDLAPQAVSRGAIEVAPRQYRNLVGAGWRALAATGHTPTRDTILIGETGPYSSGGAPGDFNEMVPLRFIRALYCVNVFYRPLRGLAAADRGCPTSPASSGDFVRGNPALFNANGWADHPYQGNSAPTVGVPNPATADVAGFAELGHLAATLDRVAEAYGSPVRLPIYSTEFGYQTVPAGFGYVPTPANAYDALPAQAAVWLNEAEYLSWRNRRIRSYDQYLLADGSASPGYDTGVDAFDGQHKPDVYAAFRMPLWLPRTAASSGSPLVVWGCVRPAPNLARKTGHQQWVRIEFAHARSLVFHTVRMLRLQTGLGCYFAASVVFPGSGAVRLAWSGTGVTLYSRTQFIMVRTPAS